MPHFVPPPWITLLCAALTLVSFGCARTETTPCPGTAIGALALHGELASTGCVVSPSGWSVPATLPDVTPTPADPVHTFDATFSWDPQTSELAYCTDTSYAAVLLGTRDGNHLQASVSLGGAVLASCTSTCTPVTTIAVEGDLAGGSDGTALSFTGTLTETQDDSQGSCGQCVLPCTTVYDLTGESR